MPTKEFIVILILSQLACLSCLYAEHPDESEVYYTVSSHDPNGLFRVDKNGEIQWSLTGIKHPQEFDIDPTGNIFVSETNGAKYLSPNKDLLWQYTTPEGTENPVAQILKDGHFLVGNEGSCKLLEINSKGETLKEIQLKSSFNESHGQFRFCQKTAEGTYLVPFTMEKAVREYDGDGKLVHDFGSFNLPVGVLRLLNGHTLIGSKARVDEFDKDGKNIWSFGTVKDGGLKEAFTAGLVRLENGNTVIAYYHDMQDVPDIIEVTADKKIVRSILIKELNHVAMVKRVDKKGNPFKDAAETPDPGLLHADLGFDEIVFVKRKPYSSDHNYTMAYNGTSADRFLAENGIYAYNLKTKQTRAIITAADCDN